MSTESVSARTMPEGSLPFILRLTRPHHVMLIVALLAAGFSAVFALAPTLVIYGISLVVLSSDPEAFRIVFLALVGLGAVVVGLLLASAANMLGHKIAFAVQKELRLALLGRMAQMPVSRIEGKAGELKKVVLGDIDRLEGLLAHVLPDMVAGLTGPIAGAVVLLFIDWRLTLSALALVPVAWFAQYWTWHGRTAIFEEWNRTEANANSALLSYVRGIATLKAFNRQASTLENVTTAIHRLRDLAVMVTRRSRYPYSLFSSALSANLLVVLPVALILHKSGLIDQAEFVLAVVLGACLVKPLNKVVFAAMILARTSVAIDRIQALLNTSTIAEHARMNPPVHNTIRFERVCFAYPEGRAVLQNIDLEINEGSLTALVGPSGAGKTTLARLLPRFEDCTSGCIRLGGVDIRDLSLAELRRRIGIVFQDPTLFHGSIRDNIGIAKPDASPERLAQAATDARVQSFGGDALAVTVSDGGSGLSGGERQRVAIARAILKDAPILILDEATAFVDAENEAEVQVALSAAGQGRTVLVIAHRLASIEHADQIIVLNEGRVEACGKHADLLRRSPTYARLWNAQQRATGWKLAAPGYQG